MNLAHKLWQRGIDMFPTAGFHFDRPLLLLQSDDWGRAGLRDHAPEHSPSKGEAVEEIRHRFRESMRLRLRSDVPLAAFLSGGIDSTFVVASMRELMPGARFSTFCASFDEAELDESPYARMRMSCCPQATLP